MKHAIVTVAALSLCAANAVAQIPLTMPQPSQQASVSQRIGVTDITITYHRPGAKGRAIWGELVPWGEVWRAGANENTTIDFSTPVKVGGREVPAGTYGLHMIPARDGDWTVILSSVSTGWGSFGYDPAEDVARVPVKPRPGPHREWLEYGFQDLGRDGVEAVLRWAELEVPLAIAVDTDREILASIRRELRGARQFSWQSWSQAANFCAQRKINVEEALGWADRSLGINENFTNLRVKAALLELEGDAAAAEALRARAMPLATEAEMNAHGYQLLGEDKVAEAIAVFEKNVAAHPESWNVYDSLAEALERKGEKARAAELYGKARTMAPASQHARITQAIERLRATTTE